MPAALKPASTIILLRQQCPEGFEVLLVKRSEQSAFMAGTHVFPGGVVDDGDGSPEMLSLVQDDDHRDGLLPLKVTGIRELFEEAGILLAIPQPDSSFTSFQECGFLRYRTDLYEGRMSFANLLLREGLVPATAHLHPYARWITPEVHPIRFDAYFFVALCPEGREAVADGLEMTEASWLSPADALAANLRGAVKLSPPAIKALEELSRFSSVDEALSSLKGCTLSPMRPLFIHLPADKFVLFPCDPDYDKFRCGERKGPLDHGKPTGPYDFSTRVVFRDGLALPYCKKGAP
jgi:8-oxo-dGTP pyrophosphatase MutT (NUDIX family)